MDVTIDDRYALEGEVGLGGMGRVYRARDVGSGARVAVKLLHRLDDEERRRFDREVRLLAALSHPAIVRYLDHGTTAGGVPYLVTEWIEGDSLDARLRGAGLGLRAGVAVCRRLAEVVGAAHAAGVVHRDLKPANVLFERSDLDRLRLIDFGIARRAGDGAALTRTGTVLGTLGFLAPEQARGDRATDPRVDVFALGCVIYLCATGRLPFPGDSLAAVQAKVLFDEPPPASQLNRAVPPGLARLIGDLLAKEPDRRPADGAAVAARIDGLEPLPDEPVLRVDAAAATLPAADGGAGQAFAVLLAGAPSRRRGPPAEAVRGALAAAVAELGAQMHPLAAGGWVILVRDRDAGAAAARAARAALWLRRAVPELPLSLSSAGALGGALDHAARGLWATTMRRIAAGGAAAAGIEVDEETARRLEGAFVIGRDGEGLWLTAERA